LDGWDRSGVMKMCGVGSAALLALLMGQAVAQECGMEPIEEPALPAALEAYRLDMETFGTDEMTADEKNTRKARESTRAVPRTATGSDGATFAVSDRFCALDYPANCSATWPDSGNPKPDGLECAGVAPELGAECNSEYMAKYMGIPGLDDTYGALTVTMSFPMIAGVVFMVLYFVWYWLRCCKLCGGRKASKECFLCASYYDSQGADDLNYKGDAAQIVEDDKRPGYVVSGGCPCGCQVTLFRLWFVLFFVLVAAAAALGVVANMDVDTGLTNTVDILFYNVQRLTFEASKMLGKLNDIMAGADLGLDASELDAQQSELGCLSESMTELENDISEGKDIVLDIRSYFVYATLVVPLLIGLVYLISAWRKWTCLVGFGSFLGWLLLLMVCVSAAIHSLLSLLLADICYEFDLHLASYHLSDSDLYGRHQNLAWLPEDAQGICGTDGDLAFVEQEFEQQFDVAIQQGLDMVADTCNQPDMQGFMDCSGVSILNGIAPAYDAKTVDYTDESCGDSDEACGASFYNGLLGDVPDQLMITDVNLTAVTVTDPADIPPEVLNCLANIPTREVTSAGGSHVEWSTDGWSDLQICMVNNVPTDDTRDRCGAAGGVFLGLALDSSAEACVVTPSTGSSVTVEGYCEITGSQPTAETTQAACEGAGNTWTPLQRDNVDPAASPVDTIISNGQACAEAAAKVYAGIEGSVPDAATVEAATTYTAPFDPDEVAALSTFPPEPDTVKDCYIQINSDNPCTTGICANPYFPRKTFRECADGCAQDEAKQAADEAVEGIDTATDLFERIHDVFVEDAIPMLRCKFVSDTLVDIFVPLCQEAYGGISLITAANYIGVVCLIISIPLGILATKRFKNYVDDNNPGTKHQM